MGEGRKRRWGRRESEEKRRGKNGGLLTMAFTAKVRISLMARGARFLKAMPWTYRSKSEDVSKVSKENEHSLAERLNRDGDSARHFVR